jgi:hypothetical protein
VTSSEFGIGFGRSLIKSGLAMGSGVRDVDVGGSGKHESGFGRTIHLNVLINDTHFAIAKDSELSDERCARVGFAFVLMMFVVRREGDAGKDERI